MVMMNIKGQWNRLTWDERWTLRGFAIAQRWKSYWGYKYKCLKRHENTELERSMETSVHD